MFKEFIARYEFWKAKKLKIGKDYDFYIDLSNKETIAIKILKKYPGVIIEYANIHMSTHVDLSFDLTIVANPNNVNTESRKFKNFTTSIFRSIINDSVEYAKKEAMNEDGNVGAVEFDSKRSVHEEVTTLFEERVPDRKPRKKIVRRNKSVHSEVQQSASDCGSGDQS
jgi:hypothetical protein